MLISIAASIAGCAATNPVTDPCGALNDFFFIDPWGNVSPCNGSSEEWIIGNIKDDSFENIMKSEKAKEVAER